MEAARGHGRSRDVARLATRRSIAAIVAALRTLRPHQEPVLAWLMPRKTAGLFLEMRLGKSLLAIRWAAPRVKRAPALVIAPSVPLIDWQDEIRKEGFDSVVLEGPSKKKVATLHKTDEPFVLVNPEGVRACPAILDREWSSIIVDESTCIANPKSQTTKVIYRHTRHVPHRLILAGKPAPEGDWQFFEQMRFLADEFMGCKNFYQWRERHFFQAGYEWLTRSKDRRRIRDAVAEHSYTLTTKAAGYSREKSYERRFVEPGPMIKKLCRQVAEEFALGEASTKWTVVCQSWLSQLAGGIVPLVYREEGKPQYYPHKFNELVRLLTEDLAGRPVVVFFKHKREIRLARTLMHQARSAPITWLDGDMNQVQRRAEIERFRTMKTMPIFVQGQIARFGLNLALASTAIFFSNHWSSLTRLQCEARIDDPMKEEPSLIIDLVSRGTVDEAVVELLQDKALSAKRFLDSLVKVSLARGFV